jgi:hypothetical protein
MANLKPDRLLSLRSGIATLILAIIYYSVSQIPESYYDTIGSLIKYKWLMIIGFLSLLIALYFFISYVLSNIKLSKLERTIDPIALTALPNKKGSIVPSKAEPYEPVQYERLHTFDGVPFKYHSTQGFVFNDYFCPKHGTKMISVANRALGRREAIIACECPMCPERFEMNEYELAAIRKSFQMIVESFVKGHLKELPSKSKA